MRVEGKPDFLVTYYVLITLGMDSQQLGQFLPNLAEWGVPPFTAPTTSLKIYQRKSRGRYRGRVYRPRRVARHRPIRDRSGSERRRAGESGCATR